MRIGDYVRFKRDYYEYKAGYEFTVECVCPISEQVHMSWDKWSIPDGYLEVIAYSDEMKELDDQTIMLWTLQLQFFQMDGLSLEELYKSVRHSPSYIKNGFTRKLDKKMSPSYSFTEDDRMCISTHLALQLSGLA